jgi:hypothetical protein
MSKSIISLELADPILHDASLRAERAGISVSAWIGSMVADRVRDEQITERFLRRRAQATDAHELHSILQQAPDTAPVPGDELD